ncbi:hypothetical protein ACFLTZ_06285 [Chloroflexota bacterium]
MAGGEGVASGLGGVGTGVRGVGTGVRGVVGDGVVVVCRIGGGVAAPTSLGFCD